MPRTPPLVMNGGWLASVFGSSSSSRPYLVWAPRKAWLAPGAAPAPSPLLRGGAPLQASPAAPVVEDEVGRALEFEHERSVVRHELFQEARGAMNRLGGELPDIDARLKAECLRLAEERHKLKVAINLGRRQRDLDNAKAKASLKVSREACSRALEEAREADHRREAAEKRAWEL